MDIEQPEPSDPFREIVAPMVEGAPDPDEVQQDLMAEECSRQAGLTAAYWKTLRLSGVPSKDATSLTEQWMALCTGLDEDAFE